MLQSFGNVATKFIRNPLGIIALLIVLVYGIAGLVASSNTFQSGERIILVLFMVLFPLIVLYAFYRLVTKYNDKLYAPSDFTNEDNFVNLISRGIEKSPKIKALENFEEEVIPLVLKSSDNDDSGTTISSDIVVPESNKEKILKVLREGKYTYRSVSGISKDTDIENKNDIKNILFELKENKLIGERDRGKGLRYFITDNGRKFLKEKGI